MKQDIAFVAQHQDGKFVRDISDEQTTRYLHSAQIYTSYCDWITDIRDKSEFKLANFTIKPVKLELINA